MKRVFITVAAMLIASFSMAQSWEVTKKKGKCTMEEAYYNQLKYKASHYDSLVAEYNKISNDLYKAETNLKVERAKQDSPVQLRTFEDSASYAIGKDLFLSWEQQRLGINVEVVGRSMIDCAKGRNAWGSDVYSPILMRFQQNFEARQHASLEKNIEAGKAFLADNRKKKDVHTTQSGLQYRIEEKGTGKRPTINDMVKVHYTGTLLDGTKFDSSYDRGEPLTFPVGQVIPGWTEGLQLMPVGSKYTFYIPHNLAYGEQEVGAIPPGSTLVFEVELLEINP